MMSDIDRNVGFGAAMTQAETAAIDAGLRSYMRRVYNYMMIGLAITGAAALGLYLLSVTGTVADASYVIRAGRVIPVPAGFVAQGRDILLTGIGYAVFVSPLKWAIIFAPLALVFGLSFGVERLRPATAQFLFWLYAAMVGLSLASIFLIYTHTSITRVFFITAASFGALSLWGYTTQRDLSGLGRSRSWACSASSSQAWSMDSWRARHCNGESRSSACWCSRVSPPGTPSGSRASISMARWTARPWSAPRSWARCRSISISSICSRC